MEIDDFTDDRPSNFAQADEALAKQRGCSPEEVKKWREENGYTWHECRDCKTMQISYCIMDDVLDNCEFNKNQLYFEYLDKEYSDTARRPRFENYIKVDIDEIYNIQLEIPKDCLTNSNINTPAYHIFNNLIIVDGFHNISVSEGVTDSKYEYITKRLKDLAVEKDVAILILHKTNNEKNDLETEGIYKKYYSKIVDLDQITTI